MRDRLWSRRAILPAAILTLGIAAVGSPVFADDAPAATAAAMKSVPIALPTEPPTGSVVLLGSKPDDLKNNFYKRYGTEPANWTVDKNGIATPQHADIVSRQEFGDFYLHVEFRTPTEGGGNAGVGLMGRYEIQILGDYGRAPESHSSGALYSQTAARVNASKKPGEWQTYDIIFRTPRFDDSGAVTEKARATVFQNGILVQDNGEFTGPTGIQYGELKGEVKTGPLILQGDHDIVQYRNVWVVPLS